MGLDGENRLTNPKIVEVEASQLRTLDADHLDAAEIVAVKVGKLR
jgi:hypothetical protein